jgi:hypothetical protein
MILLALKGYVIHSLEYPLHSEFYKVLIESCTFQIPFCHTDIVVRNKFMLIQICGIHYKMST